MLKLNLSNLLSERGMRMVNLSLRKFQTPSPSSKSPSFHHHRPRVLKSCKQNHKRMHPNNRTLPNEKIQPLQKILSMANQKLKPNRRCKAEKICRLARLQSKATVARVKSQSRKSKWSSNKNRTIAAHSKALKNQTRRTVRESTMMSRDLSRFPSWTLTSANGSR